MERSVYLETSFVSECVGDRDDATSIYRRGLSLEWWAAKKYLFNCFISAAVVEELSDPEYPHKEAALALIERVPLLQVTDEVFGLARVLIREKVMPGPVEGDALHVAVAAIHGIDYILTWNVRHLANPSKVIHLGVICLREGILAPQLVTPDLLWEEPNERFEE